MTDDYSEFCSASTMHCSNGQAILERYEALLASDKYFDTRDHLPYLRSVAKGNVLEIGTDVGNSTTALLLGVKENGGHLTSVDIKDCSHLFFGDHDWSFIQCDSMQMAERGVKDKGPFSVVYIDGAHDFTNAMSDLLFAHNWIRPGGLILMHDILAPQFPGVRQAFDEVTLPKSIREGSWGLGIVHVPE